MPGITGLLTAIPLADFPARKKNVVPWFRRPGGSSVISLTVLPHYFLKPHILYAILVILALCKQSANCSRNILMCYGAVAGPTAVMSYVRDAGHYGCSTALFSFLVASPDKCISVNYQLHSILSIGHS